MFIWGGLSILSAVPFLLLVAILTFSRKLKWFGRLPGDMRYEGRRAGVFALLVSMLLPSPVLSPVMYPPARFYRRLSIINASKARKFLCGECSQRTDLAVA